MTERPKYPRTGCVVPFCRRTSTLFQGEWICGEHWRCVSPHLRRRHHKLARAYRKADAAQRYGRANRLIGLFERNWARIKRHAIERAGGIA